MLQLLLLLPLGILAGLLSGFLGIGGGLIFSPLLLALGLEPHEALATSTLAIVPTTAAGSWAHWRQGRLPLQPALVIALAALASGLGFALVGKVLSGWHLLAVQALVYALVALLVRPRQQSATAVDSSDPSPALLPLALVGCIAGLCGGQVGGEPVAARQSAPAGLAAADFEFGLGDRQQPPRHHALASGLRPEPGFHVEAQHGCHLPQSSA